MTLMRPVVKVVRLGLTNHQYSYQIQKYFASKLLGFIAGRSSVPAYNTLLLQEHHPVYTIGLRSKDYTRDLEEKLLSTGAEFVKTNRGGLITWHGPGQLVAYPILHLRDFRLSMKCYICSVENTVIRLCAEFGLKGEKSPHTGVWIGDNKIAAIGVHGSRYVTTHGVAVNIDPDLSWFSHIVPCGIPDKGVTSLARELHPRQVSVNEATDVFLSSFREQFECDLEEHSGDILMDDSLRM